MSLHVTYISSQASNPAGSDTTAASAEAAPAKWWHVSDERILEMLQPPAQAATLRVEEVMDVGVWDTFCWGFGGKSCFLSLKLR